MPAALEGGRAGRARRTASGWPRDGAAPLGPEAEAQLRAGALVGTPEEVAERIRAFEEAAGAGIRYVARLSWPGLDPALQREAIRVFGERVLPALRPTVSEAR